jgi:hypothetical protein
VLLLDDDDDDDDEEEDMRFAFWYGVKAGPWFDETKRLKRVQTST